MCQLLCFDTPSFLFSSGRLIFQECIVKVSASFHAGNFVRSSVTNIQVAEALAKAGLEVDRKIIYIKESVKEVGTYKATVKLHKEVSVEISFEVVAE